MGDLQGRIALVTGGAQGIGRAIAEELAAAGAVLALADVNEAKLAETVGEFKAQGVQAEAFTVNVSSRESIEAGAKAIIEKFGKAEIIVNNAGITRDNLMLRMKPADWDLVLSINLTGAFLLTQALLSPMLKNRWGRIVSIASVVGRAGQASTDWKMNAELLSYSRNKGLFAGIDLDGTSVSQNKEDTELYYGAPEDFQIVLRGDVPVPDGAVEFVKTVAQYFVQAKQGK